MRKAISLISMLFSIGNASAAFNAFVNFGDIKGEITFTIPQEPPPLSCALGTDCFSLSPVVLTIDGTTFGDGTVSFYTQAAGGGVTILVGSTVEVSDQAPGNEQLFSGTLADPTIETFSNLQLVSVPNFSPVLNDDFILNISLVNVPEPSEAMLLLVALLCQHCYLSSTP